MTDAARSPLAPRAELAPSELVEALTVAMAAAPGVYSRNRHFALHERPEAKLAKRRAALLRGILRHLAKACNMHISIGRDTVEMRYRLEDLAFERRCELSPTELACVRYLARRAGRPVPGGDVPEGAASDAHVVEATLAKLGPRIAEGR